MDSVTRNVKDIDSADRLAIEHVIGKHLSQDQQLVIHVLDSRPMPSNTIEPNQHPSHLPDWCNVYEGLNEAEIAEIESSIVRSGESRSVR
jgi:hypothetical protein